MNPKPMPDRGRAAIFDLDGTLADTAPDLVLAANDLLEELDLPPLDLPSTRNTAGMGGRALLRLGHERGGRPAPTGAAMEAMYERYLAVYERGIDRSTCLFDGVAETLDRLASAGWRLGVCTNKPEAPARLLLDRLGIAARFRCILGGDSLPVRKPDPLHLRRVIEGVGGRVEQSVLVGDSSVDLGAARNAGVACVLMSYGYASTPVGELGADAVLDSFAGLVTLLPKLVPARLPGDGEHCQVAGG